MNRNNMFSRGVSVMLILLMMITSVPINVISYAAVNVKGNSETLAEGVVTTTSSAVNITTGSAISLSVIPEDILEKVKKSDDLTKEQLEIITSYYELTLDEIKHFEKLSYNLYESVSMVRAIHKYNLTIEDVKEIKTQEALNRLISRLMVLEVYLEKIEIDDKELRNLTETILKGQTVTKVYTAYIASKAYQLSIEELLLSDQAENQIKKQISDKGIEIESLAFLMEVFPFDVRKVCNLDELTEAEVDKILNKLIETESSMAPKRLQVETSMRAMGHDESEHDTTNGNDNLDNYKALNAPFVIDNGNESINQLTGDLSYKIPLIKTKGRGSMGIDLNIEYSSEKATLRGEYYNLSTSIGYTVKKVYTVNAVAYKALSNGESVRDINSDVMITGESEEVLQNQLNSLNQTEEIYYEIVNLPTVMYKIRKESKNSRPLEGFTDDTYIEAHDKLAAGWEYRLPSVEKRNDGGILHLVDGSEYKIVTNYTFNPDGLIGCRRNDLKMRVEEGDFSNGSIDSYYTLQDLQGNKTYFDNMGYIIGSIDKYENKIIYDYDLISGKRYLTDIIDSAGNELKINYQISGNKKLQTYKLNGKNQMVLEFDRIDGTHYILTSAQDAESRITRFQYEAHECSVIDNSYYSKFYEKWIEDREKNDVYLLSRIQYPTEATTNYEYCPRKSDAQDMDTYTAVFGGTKYSLLKRYDEDKGERRKELSIRYDIFYSEKGTLEWKSGYSSDKVSRGHFSNRFTYGNGLSYLYCFDDDRPEKTTVLDESNTRISETLTEYDNRRNLLKSEETNYQNGRVSETKITTYVYDNYSNLIKVTLPDGVIKKFTYQVSPYNLLITQITEDSSGTILAQITNHLKSSGDKDIESQTQLNIANGVNKSFNSYFKHDIYGNLISETHIGYDGKRKTTEYEYSPQYGSALLSRNRVYYTSKDIKSGQTKNVASENQYIYDTASQLLLKTVNPDGLYTEIDYDNLGRVIKKTAPLGEVSYYSYDDKNNKLIAKLPNGYEILLKYDGFGRLVKFGKKDSAASDFTTLLSRTYSSEDNILTETDALSNQTDYTYDILGRNDKTIYADGGNVITTYNDVDRIITTTDPLGGKTYVKYDINGNEIETGIYSGSQVILNKTAYDSSGRPIRKTDAKGNITEYTYDMLNQLISVRDAIGQETKYEYDGLGSLTKKTTSGGSVTQINNDELGRMIEVQNPMGLKESYQYDNKGNLVFYKDKTGQLMTSTYDAGNRLLSKQTNDTLIQYKYVPKTDNLESIISGSEIVNYSYDETGLLTKAIENGKSVSYSYNNLGKKIQRIDQNGTKTAYLYDSMNRLLKVIDGKETSYTYNLLGQKTKVLYPNGLYAIYGYNGIHQLINIKYYKANGTKLYEESLTYDLNGNITKRTTNDGNYLYEYDKLNRLKKETEPSGLVSEYEFDGNGNIIKKIIKDPSGKTEFCFMGKNYSMNNIKTHTIAYTYDKADNLIKTDECISNGKAKQIIISLNKAVATLGERIICTVSGYYLEADGSKTPIEQIYLNNAKWRGSADIKFLQQVGSNVEAEVTKDGPWSASIITELLYTSQTSKINIIEKENTIKTLTVTPSKTNIRPGETVELKLTGIYNDGTAVPKNIINKASWTTGDEKLVLNRSTGEAVNVTLKELSSLSAIPINIKLNNAVNTYKLTVIQPVKGTVTLNTSVLHVGESATATVKFYDASGSQITAYATSLKSNIGTIEIDKVNESTYRVTNTGNSQVDEGTLIGTMGSLSIEEKFKLSNIILGLTPNKGKISDYDELAITMTAKYADGKIVPDSIISQTKWSSLGTGAALIQIRTSNGDGKTGKIAYLKAKERSEVYLSFELVGTIGNVSVKAPCDFPRKSHHDKDRSSASEYYVATNFQEDTSIEANLETQISFIHESQNVIDVNAKTSSGSTITATNGEVHIIENFKYDANGNQIESIRSVTANGADISTGSFSSVSPEIKTYKYNGLGQMIESNNEVGLKTTYSYNPNGMRKDKTNQTGKYGYYYDGGNIIIETKDGSQLATVQRGGQILYRDMSGKRTYYLLDSHGDVVGLYDESGNEVSHYIYDAYGNGTKKTGEVENPYRYTGQYLDEETGFYYLRARYYNPKIMRFITEDSYLGDIKNPLSLNLYGYCMGNPVMLMDYNGHWSLSIGAIDSNISIELKAIAVIMVLMTASAVEDIMNLVDILDSSSAQTSSMGLESAVTTTVQETELNLENESTTEGTSEDGLFDPLDNHTVINGKLPTTGDANSSMDYVDDAGDLIRRRFFDENGNVIKDVDFTDHGNPKLHPDVPHEHYWEWNDGIPKRLK